MCHICDIVFENDNDLKSHFINIHTIQNCQICNIMCLNLDELNEHKKNVHEGKNLENVREKESISMKHLNRNLEVENQLVEYKSSNENENQIEKVLSKEQRSEYFGNNFVQLDANYVSKFMPNTSFGNDFSIDMSKSSNNKQDVQDYSTNSIDEWCIRCEMMANPIHRKLCATFCNLAVKNSRGEIKCYFCDMKFRFKNKAYYHIKLKHFSKKVVIVCKKLSNEMLDKYREITMEENIQSQMLDPQFGNFIESTTLPIDAVKITKEKIQSGFVKCDICNLSFCGTSSTLKMHMNDVHQKENKQIDNDHEGQEIYNSSLNVPTTLIEHDVDDESPQYENATIYVNIENTSESTKITLEQDLNQILIIDPLNVPDHVIKNEKNDDDEGMIDPLNISVNQIETERDSSQQEIINFSNIFDNSTEAPNNPMIPLDDSNSDLLEESENNSCKFCGLNIDEEKLKTHERFCA